MSTIYRKYDAGEASRGKVDKGGDCQIRALCTAAGMTYKAAWEALYKLCGKYRTCGFNLTHYLDSGELGVVRKLKFPAEAGKPRMTPAEFVRKYRKGTFVLHLAHHVVGVEDGIVYDTWDCTKKCVYGAWEIKPTK